MLIVGRTIQGIGGGGVTMLVDLIVCDLVPLRKRGSVMGIIFGAVTIGTALGPFIGGVVVERATWRWVFYLNLPIGAAAIALLLAFLHVRYEKDSALFEKIKRVDFAGNAIFACATAAILIALTNGWTKKPWESWRTIFPLVFGLAGLGLFYLFEASTLCVEPSLPPQLFANRTSATAFTLTFIHTLLMYWEIYFMPIYFQAVLGSSPAHSGVQILPTVIMLMVFGAIGGGAMQKFGRYRPFHHAGFALMTIGFGTFSILDSQSSMAMWVVFQIIFAAGTGLSIGTLLAAVQAELCEVDSATATGVWAVIRSFGTIWGITLSAVTFNSQCTRLSLLISDSTARSLVSGGQAYEHATANFVNSLISQSLLRHQIISVYSESLKLVWQVATGISALGFLLVFLEKEVELRTELETEFGMEDRREVTENDT